MFYLQKVIHPLWKSEDTIEVTQLEKAATRKYTKQKQFMSKTALS